MNFHDATSTEEEIHCSLDLEKVYRISNGSPVCVTPYSASVLIEYGYAILP